MLCQIILLCVIAILNFDNEIDQWMNNPLKNTVDIYRMCLQEYVKSNSIFNDLWKLFAKHYEDVVL